MLAPLQQAEAIDIRRKSDAFGEKVEDFRKFFQQKAPFSVPGGELKLEHVSLSYCKEFEPVSIKCGNPESAGGCMLSISDLRTSAKYQMATNAIHDLLCSVEV